MSISILYIKGGFGMDKYALKQMLNEIFEKEMYEEYLDLVGFYLSIGGVL